MKMSKEDLGELLEILEQAETFRPIVDKVLETIKSYSKELSELPEKFLQWTREERVKSVEFYKSKGFSHDDSIIMTLDDIYGIQKLNEKKWES